MNEKAALLLKKSSYGLDELREIMELLRAPDGCPWDREQTHKSIRRDLLEETYEVAEAIDNDDDVLLCEELGDLMLQVVFHARIAEEEGKFTLDDAVDGICRKMILRHPHVFGDVSAETTEQVLTNWDAIKKVEKSQKSDFEVLDSVAKTMPALMRAAKLSAKAKKLGRVTFEEDEKLDKASVGERLYTLAAQAKAAGLDPEKELSDYCERVISGFKS